METYITFSFWAGCFATFVRSIWLVGKHPRTQVHSVGEDTFQLIVGIVLLAWVAYLKFN